MSAAPPPDSTRTRRRAYRGISGGVTLICVGTVLLLNTLGVLGWGVWFDLLKMWPLVLVSIGLRWIFVNTRAHLLCLMGPVLIALATVWIVSTHSEASEPSGGGGLVGGETISLDCPPPSGDGPARLDLDFAAGDVRFIAEPAPAPAAGAKAGAKPSGFRGTLRFKGPSPRTSCFEGSGALRLSAPNRRHGVHVVLPFGDWQNRWEARLAASAPVSLHLNVAASNAEIDLRGFALQRVEVDAAASRLRLQLGPARAKTQVRIDGAVDHVRLVIPEGVCYTVWREKVLSFLDVDDHVHEDNRWRRVTADACASAPPDAPRYEIRYELPLSSVTIETEPPLITGDRASASPPSPVS